MMVRCALWFAVGATAVQASSLRSEITERFGVAMPMCVREQTATPADGRPFAETLQGAMDASHLAALIVCSAVLTRHRP